MLEHPISSQPNPGPRPPRSPCICLLFVDGPILGEYFLVGLVCRPGEREHLPVNVDRGEVRYVDVPVNGNEGNYCLIPSEFPSTRFALSSWTLGRGRRTGRARPARRRRCWRRSGGLSQASSLPAGMHPGFPVILFLLALNMGPITNNVSIGRGYQKYDKGAVHI